MLKKDLPAWIRYKRLPIDSLRLIKLTKSFNPYGLNFEFAFLEVTQNIIVHKKIDHNCSKSRWLHFRNGLIELTIPRGAIVCINNQSAKSRTNMAIVRDHNKKLARSFQSAQYGRINYEPFSFVFPKGFCIRPTTECHSGIHFFFKKGQAHRYN